MARCSPAAAHPFSALTLPITITSYSYTLPLVWRIGFCRQWLQPRCLMAAFLTWVHPRCPQTGWTSSSRRRSRMQRWPWLVSGGRLDGSLGGGKRVDGTHSKCKCSCSSVVVADKGKRPSSDSALLAQYIVELLACVCQMSMCHALTLASSRLYHHRCCCCCCCCCCRVCTAGRDCVAEPSFLPGFTRPGAAPGILLISGLLWCGEEMCEKFAH